ncbi:MAG: hypothetical protein AAGN82_09435 [Myxococcota bacterium]
MTLVGQGCRLGAVPFACARDEQCVDGNAAGRCEPEGYCSFPDPACATKRRYGIHAVPSLSEQCVAQCIDQVVLGDAHGCLRKSDGTVMCWGTNDAGQLGPAVDAGAVAGPTVVSGLPPSVGLAAGGRHTCSVSAAGDLHCWGDGREGQVAGGRTSVSPEPSLVVRADGRPLAPIGLVSLGRGHTCATVAEASGVHCWGSNASGQLGVAGASSSAPVFVSAGETNVLRELEAGGDGTCARADGGIFCWGRNACGKLGFSMMAVQPAPMRAVGLGEIEGDFAVGGGHACGFDGEQVQCWGAWDGTPCGDTGRPAPTVGDDPEGIFTAERLIVRTGRAHSCVIDEGDGDTLCWGSNRCADGRPCGQLGPSATDDTDTAIVVPLGDVRTVDLTTGGDASCAVTDDGSVWCWGDDAFGQLGLPPGEERAPGEAVDAVGRSVSCM